MKISTKLKVAALIPTLMAVAIALTLMASDRFLEEIQVKNRAAIRVINSMNELGSLVFQYVLYHEDRPVRQFLAGHDSISRFIDTTRFKDRRQRLLLEDIERDIDSMRGAFLKIVSNHEQNFSADPDMRKEVESRLAGRLMVWSGDVVSHAAQLERLVHEELSINENRVNVLIFALIVATTLFLSFILWRITKSITVPLTTLHKGTEVVGAGDLEYTVDLPARDEIGLLARSFNRMTEQLREMTVSKITLQKEIEEKTKAQEALRRSAEKFRVVADFTFDWEYWRSPENTFLYVSPSCERITGYTREEIMEDPTIFPRILHPEDREAVLEHMREDLLYQEPCDLEFRILTRDGRERWIAHVCSMVLDDDGYTMGRRASNRDITERKKAENELNIYKNKLEILVKKRTLELERRNQELQDFTFVASHDLQEPLRKIRTFGDILLAKFDKSSKEQLRNHVHRIRETAAGMQALLKALLTYSHLTSSEKPLERVSLKKPLQEALNNLEGPIHQTGARVEVGDLPEVEADPRQMVQLFQHLIGNALKFHKEDKTPEIMIYARKDLYPGPDNGEVCKIYVQDNGIGFEEAQYLEKIFQPFQRLHHKDIEGVGIGLTLCYKIVERHGGTLTARSRPGKGSTFIVALPKRHKEKGETHE